MKTNIKRFSVGAVLTLASLGAFAAPKFVPTYTPAITYAPGIESVGKISELRKEGKIKEGEALLSTIRGSSQLQDMARFALYRDDKAKTDEMNALLKGVVEVDETSFWGTAAMGYLNLRGVAPLSLYWPWKDGELTVPTTTIKYGVDRAFREPGFYTIDVKGAAKISAIELNVESGTYLKLTPPFEFELPSGVAIKTITLHVNEAKAGELKIARRVLKPRASAAFSGLAPNDGLAAKYIRSVVGEDTINEIGAKEGGREFLERFFADTEWTEEFAGSGPWSCQAWQGMNDNLGNAAKALKTLDTLVFNDDGSILNDKAARNVATALALNHGYDRDEEWLVQAYALYRDWLKDGSLIAETKNYDVRKWREVVGFGQNSWLTIEDLRWSHNFVKNVAPAEYGGMCWQCSYRMDNCFGESVQGPMYYRPWEHRDVMQKRRFYVGGVCGSLSNFGAHIAETHGIRAFSAGQPGHCAYMLWDYEKDRWNVAYSVTGHTGPHNSLGGGGFAAANEQQLYYAHPDRMAAERLRWQGKYEEAMRKVPGNWCAAVAWFNALERSKAPIEAYEPYAAAVRETFSTMPSEGFQLYLPYLKKLTNREAKLNAAIKALKTMKEGAYEVAEAGYFDEIALNPLKQLFANDAEANWAILDAALDGQAGTKSFYRQAVNWGSTNLVRDEESTRRFIGIVAASVEKTGSAIDYKEMLLTASKSGDIEMFHQVYAILDKFSSELKPKPTDRSWPTEKAGAGLISPDGMLMTSSTSPWDWPIVYRDALTAQGFGEGNAFHTGKETAPWGMVKLPGPAEIKAITIVNSGSRQNASRQIPLSIWSSEDGKTFTHLGTFTKVQDEWTLEILAPIKARYIKVGRKIDDRNDFFHLYKILVYGKKLY